MSSYETGVEKTKLKLIERDGEKCVKCGSVNELTIDHIIPVSFLEMMGIFRKHTLSKKHHQNLQLLCRKCNSLKRERFDWTDKRTKPLILWYLDSIDEDLSPDFTSQDTQ